jgi:Icc protein
MLIAQITDCHIVEPGSLVADRIDPSVGLLAAIELINGLDPLPDLVLATGDLVNDGARAQYDQLMVLLAALSVPVLAIPGNHDVRTELRERFPSLPSGGADDPVDYVVDEHPVRLIGLDTTIPGRNDGQVTAVQMHWLDDQLSAEPERPTVIFQHHPPFRSGIPWMDRDNGFAGSELEADVLRRHSQVEAVVCGHLHRAVHRRFGGTVASSWPSTAVQLSLDLGDGSPRYSDEPSAIALHEYRDGSLNSHVVPVVTADRWTPSWAR